MYTCPVKLFIIFPWFSWCHDYHDINNILTNTFMYSHILSMFRCSHYTVKNIRIYELLL